MKTKTIIAALILSATTHAPADPPATSADLFMAQQQAAADAARIQAQNARMIELQEKAVRAAESANHDARSAAWEAARARYVAPVSQEGVISTAELIAKLQRPVAQPTRPPEITEAAIIHAAAEIRAIRSNAELTAAEKNLNVYMVIYKLTHP